MAREGLGGPSVCSANVPIENVPVENVPVWEMQERADRPLGQSVIQIA